MAYRYQVAQRNPMATKIVIGVAGVGTAAFFAWRYMQRVKLADLLRSHPVYGVQAETLAAEHIAWFGIKAADEAYAEIVGSTPGLVDTVAGLLPASVQTQIAETRRDVAQAVQTVETTGRSGLNVGEDTTEGTWERAKASAEETLQEATDWLSSLSWNGGGPPS